jgi:hypothetical protein
MQAKYPGHCNLCNSPIVEGDEITRDNNQRPHSFFVHSTCLPTSGRVRRAGYRVTIIKADPNGYLPAGHSRQFVYESKANSQAEYLRTFGCEVEVTAL